MAVVGPFASLDAGGILTSDENCPLGAFIRSHSNPVGERIEYVQFVFPGPI